jgi:hypothetical protein
MGAVAVFRSPSVPALDDPDFPRALDLARHRPISVKRSGQDAIPRRFHVRDAAQLLDVFYVVRQSPARILVNDQRVPYGRELWIPLVSFPPSVTGEHPRNTPGRLRRQRDMQARDQHEGPRGAVQHASPGAC